MAYRAYQPTKPAFRKVKKLRGKNTDNMSLELMASYNHDPYQSIYVKEICKKQANLSGARGGVVNGGGDYNGPRIATHNQRSGAGGSRAKNGRASGPFSYGQNGPTDASMRTFKARNTGSDFRINTGSKRKRGSRAAQKDKEFNNMFADNNRNQRSAHQPNFASSSLLKNTGMNVAGPAPTREEYLKAVPPHLRGGDQNPYLDNQLAIDDSDFYKEGWENGRPTPETLVEKNMHSILLNNPNFRARCLRVGYPLEKKSIYKNDFIPMKTDPNPSFDPNQQFKPENPMDLGTINSNDFVPPAKFNMVEPKPQDRRSGLDDGAEHLKAPIIKNTHYMTDYPDWGVPPKTGPLKPTVPKTVASGMPFHGKPIYRDYGNFDKQPLPDKINPDKGQKNPLGVDLPFIGDTNYNNFFRPFKVGKGTKGPELDKVNEKTPIYDGQYKPIYKDYDGRPATIDDPKKPCCVVTPEQKVWMVNESTARILKEASPQQSDAIMSKYFGPVYDKAIFDFQHSALQGKGNVVDSELIVQNQQDAPVGYDEQAVQDARAL